jgi:RNA polymerase sigma-70 factor (ECF subfamily)
MFHQYRLLKSYLYTIVRNGSINWLKARTRRRIALNDPAADTQQPEKLAWENLIQAELIRQLHAGISRLPAQRQRVFKMLYQEGKSVKEVAEELNLSISAIKDHKRAGLIFLRKILPVLAVLTLCKS